MNKSTLHIEGLSKHYEKKAVLQDLHIEIAPQSLWGIVGHNGAGKSTLLKSIVGLIPYRGAIRYFEGQHLTVAVKRQIGFYLGKEQLPLELSGREYLQFLKLLYQAECSDKDLEELFDYFFDDRKAYDQRIGSYSQGMCQKIGICGAILHQPALLLLDEPFTGLDIASVKNLMALLQQYSTKGTLLISSHDLHLIERLCSHLLVLEQGAVQYQGLLQDFVGSGAQKQHLEEVLATQNPLDSSTKQLSWF